jgi:hypothetical protein
MGTPKILEFDCKGQNTLHWGFFISLESYQNVDVENGFAWAIWTSTAQVMAKWKAMSQIGSLTPDHYKLGIDPTLMRAGGVWHTVESSRRELQLCFRPRPNRRSEKKVIVPQSCGSPNRGRFGTPKEESRDKKPFGCGCCGEAQRIYTGKVVASLESERWWVLWVQSCSWLVLSLKVF